MHGAPSRNRTGTCHLAVNETLAASRRADGVMDSHHACRAVRLEVNAAGRMPHRCASRPVAAGKIEKRSFDERDEVDLLNGRQLERCASTRRRTASLIFQQSSSTHTPGDDGNQMQLQRACRSVYGAAAPRCHLNRERRRRANFPTLTETLAPMARRFPGLRFWESTRPLCLEVECTLVTLPSSQRPTSSGRLVAQSFSPLSFGTTHAANALTVRVAFGVEVDAQELSSATWKTFAAPVHNLTPGAPTSAVAPSAESTPNARRSLVRPPESVRVAVGAELEAQAPSSATR